MSLSCLVSSRWPTRLCIIQLYVNYTRYMWYIWLDEYFLFSLWRISNTLGPLAEYCSLLDIKSHSLICICCSPCWWETCLVRLTFVGVEVFLCQIEYWFLDHFALCFSLLLLCEEWTDLSLVGTFLIYASINKVALVYFRPTDSYTLISFNYHQILLLVFLHFLITWAVAEVWTNFIMLLMNLDRHRNLWTWRTSANFIFTTALRMS